MLKYTVCNGLLRDGIVALVNIDDKPTVSSFQIKHLAEHMRILYFDSHWDDDKTKTINSQSQLNNEKYSISIHPNWSNLSKSFIDLINFNQWHNFTLIYEDSDGKSI